MGTTEFVVRTKVRTPLLLWTKVDYSLIFPDRIKIRRIVKSTFPLIGQHQDAY